MDEQAEARAHQALVAELDRRLLAPAAVREQDARDYPHDLPCPRCGRRQWGVGYADPTDKQQETCSACGYEHTEEG